MSPALWEQRREPRRTAHGTVMVRIGEPKPFVVQGRLVDVSTHGFRMAHECSLLESGQVVEFSHGYAVGQARVVWNRIFEHRVETGFLLVGRSEEGQPRSSR
jgi:hypothetical protein